jgi:transcriptional regulator of acetoin/glycerol metabolism
MMGYMARAEGRQERPMTLSQRTIRAARDAFISSGIETPGLRPATLDAWRRSKAAGVTSSGTPTLRMVDDIDVDSSLLRSVRPVTEELLRQFATSDVAMMVTDRDARIVGRWTSGTVVARHLDRMGVHPGTIFDEALVGSTGLGTPLEAAGPIVVEGAEHYNDSFDAVVAVGAPIVHPGTGVVEGVLDLVAPTGAPIGLMLPLVSQAVREAGNRLVSGYAREDRELLDAFMQIERRGPRRPMLAVNSRLMMANTHAGAMLGSRPHLVLWEEISRAIADGQDAVYLGDEGSGVIARIRKISHSEGCLGAVLQLGPADRSVSPQVRPSSPARTLAARIGHRLPGHSLRWTRAVSSLAEALVHGVPVLLAGPAGVGKSALGRIAAELWEGREPDHVDASHLLDDAWDVRAAEASRAVIVEGLGPEADLPAVMALVDTWSAQGRRVILTWHDPSGAELPEIIEQRIHAVIELPSLAHRPNDIGDLIHAWSTRREDGGCPVEVDAVRDLVQRLWPGNVRELFRTLDIAASNRTGPRIRLDDLPSPDQPGPRRQLTFLESVEREAIAKLLKVSGGSKVDVARELGISRSTLYRKLAALGLDD